MPRCRGRLSRRSAASTNVLVPVHFSQLPKTTTSVSACWRRVTASCTCRRMGQDELFTVVNFVDVPSIWTTISTNDAFNNHVGYSVVAHLAEGVFGRAEWVFRLPALLLGLATIPLVWLFARSVLPFPIPLLTALLLPASPPHIVWSTNPRACSALAFFAVLTTLA